MTSLPFIQVDAFADRPFAGNPAAVMPLEEWLPDDVLQAIALENNLSETAFTVPTEGDADYELRWFTPATEVTLCGHATLASGHALIAGDRVRFRTRKAGILTVERQGDGYALSLPAWKPEPAPLPIIVDALGCKAIETFWHLHRYGLVVVETADEVLNLKPDFQAMAKQGDVLTIVTAPGRETDIISRVFAPGAGIDEDPVTGSAHAVMVPYWAERLGRDSFTAFQASKRGGHLTCRLDGDRVILGGRCVTVIEGQFRL
ncbi:PhzF family phenazine biosynthesis protein [Allosphingosinicella flava]|uniref:PhzF family phenazine biosynthesis protein n=1 Tax=Allosphingosinicella flava TaxID=2771430 RepID=A0A7T2GJ48_9SPHN|nr:PhzF family phenazine biosynthesis protein [Sphingosinicella flava]QPQ54822.1 PhzF family phenazine biosynthesis protein [Sphingosinicella flava]